MLAADDASGFADEVLAAQSVFRTILDAFAAPGQKFTIAPQLTPPAGLPLAAAAVLLTLADHETPLWLPADHRAHWLPWIRMFIGAPLAEQPDAARFAVVSATSGTPPLAAFDLGTDRYPDRSATVVITCPNLEDGMSVSLTGPGIEHARMIAPAGLCAGFWQQWAENHAAYPRGVDIIFVTGADLIALPRSVAAQPATSANRDQA